VDLWPTGRTNSSNFARTTNSHVFIRAHGKRGGDWREMNDYCPKMTSFAPVGEPIPLPLKKERKWTQMVGGCTLFGSALVESFNLVKET
jgi:hypothetical protein